MNYRTTAKIGGLASALLLVGVLTFSAPARAANPYMELVVVNQGVVLYENDNVTGQVTIQSINAQLCVADFPHFGCYPLNSQVNEYPKS